MVIRRRRKVKMIIEEAEEDPIPKVDEASVFVKALNTHVLIYLLPFVLEEETRSREWEDVPLIDEMEVAPATEESVPVDTGHIIEGVDLIVKEEGKQQAPVDQDEDNDDDDDEDDEAEAAQPQSPESATSIIALRAWKCSSIQSQTGVHGNANPLH